MEVHAHTHTARKKWTHYLWEFLIRYFRSTAFQSQIGNLSVMIANVRSRNEREYSYVEFYQRPFSIKHFDFTWYDTLTEHGNLQ